MRNTIFLFLISLFFFRCSQSEKLKSGSKEWLEDIIQSSDTTYKKPYFRRDFVTAYYYVNRKDSIVCQVMKDSLENIRQIFVANKNIRTFYAQYYANGQIQADLPLDKSGQFNGTIINYYENGQIMSKGKFTHGLKTGKWRNYDSTGNLISTDLFDKTGQLIN